LRRFGISNVLLIVVTRFAARAIVTLSRNPPFNSMSHYVFLVSLFLLPCFLGAVGNRDTVFTSKSSGNPAPRRHFGSSTSGNSSLVLDSNSCANIGDLNIYQHNVPLVSRYGGKANSGVFLPVYASRSLAGTNTKISTVIIMIHGLLRNADDVFCDALNGLDPSKKQEVLVIAPWFTDASFNGSSWNAQVTSTWAQSSKSVYWNTSNWMDGGDNSPGNGVPGNYSSSFDALDTLVSTVRMQGLFPNLKLITIAGFSAGGQMVNRFSWATIIDSKSATVARNKFLASKGLRQEAFIPIRYIVSDASSYLYLSPMRPVSSCLPLYNNGYDATTAFCDDFAVPQNVNTTCMGYDKWKFGLSLTPPPKDHRYIAAISLENGGIQNRTRLFFQKDLRFILGGSDVCNCNAQGFTNDESCYEPSVNCTVSTYGGQYCCDTYPDAGKLSRLSRYLSMYTLQTFS